MMWAGALLSVLLETSSCCPFEILQVAKSGNVAFSEDYCCLKKNLDASRRPSSEHPLVRGGNVKAFRAIIIGLVVVVDDSHSHRVVLTTEETAGTQVSHRRTTCMSILPPGHKKVRRSTGHKHHGENPLLKPIGVQITKNSLPGLTTRELRKHIGVKTMSLGTSYSFYCHSLECCQYFRI